jgi:dTDP-4-amino-4,6-dideoxygalactose transaminase
VNAVLQGNQNRVVRFASPLIGAEEIGEVVDTLRSEWLTTGPKTKRFEGRFVEYIGAPAALALNSCTAGLHLALRAEGIGPGHEVITTPVTFAATVNVIEHVGATPILVDVDADTLNLDPVLIEAAITDRTRAIMPVHFAGHPVDLDAVTCVAERHRLSVIEDAAHALPARYKGRMIGSGANAAAFSFYATKNLTTAEGGMLTGDSDLVERARILSLHGMSRDAWNRYDAGGSWFYDVVVPGFKCNMTDIQASLGLRQLEKLEAFQRRRREIVAAYNSAFAENSALELPVERTDVEHAWHLYVLRLRRDCLRIGRDQFIHELRARRVCASVHFIPIHLHSYYRNKYGFRPNEFPVAWDNYCRMLSLPLSPALTSEDVAQVIQAVDDIIAQSARRAA